MDQSPGEMLKLGLRSCLAMYYSIYLSVLEIWHYFYPKPGKSLVGKHVLITGGGGALGRELALSFAKEGCHVTVVDVNETECQETSRLVQQEHVAVKDHVTSYRLDVTSRDDVSSFAKRVTSEKGPVDILVNNAGIVQAGSLLSTSEDQIMRIIDVNLLAQFWTIKAFLPGMIERPTGGHIVAISSAAALAVAANIAPYTASKAGVSALMGCLREELRKHHRHIKTTTVQPFFLAPPQDKKHWEVKSVLPDITAASVARATVRAVKREKVTLTIPTYLYFVMYYVRLIPAKAADWWRDIFAADIDSIKNK
ncbi:epidermal retinol dehydrogenase 2-like isoform X2 [Macrosteles quadrilineatus]|nr:epidermal retinol dehydrogenase 2-like isoform X2 [Macrosteles quadrilineatus]